MGCEIRLFEFAFGSHRSYSTGDTSESVTSAENNCRMKHTLVKMLTVCLFQSLSV